MHFEPAGENRFISRGSAMTAVLFPEGARLFVRSGAKNEAENIDLQLEKGNPAAHIEGRELLDAKVNYLIGDQAQWKRDLPSFGRIHYEQVYPGIDMEFYGTGEKIEYDFVLKPGADVRRVRLRVRGNRGLLINSAGDLEIQTKGGVPSRDAIF
jgi:hypothetical protein